MKIILLLLILITTTDTQAQQRRRRRRPPTRKATPSTPANQQLSFRKTPNIVLLDSNFKEWENFLIFPEEGRITYSAVYHLPRNNIFFFATMIETNTIPHTLEPSKTIERLFTPSLRENSLLYVGDLSKTERVFMNTNKNIMYVKKITPLRDTNYIDNGSFLFPNKEPVYPVLTTLFEVQYTNRSGLIFNRILQQRGILRLLGEVDTRSLLQR